MTVQWVRRLVAIFLCHRQAFNHRPIYVGFEVKWGSWNDLNATWELKFQMKLKAKGVCIYITLKCIRYVTPKPASCGELKARTLHQGRNLRVNLDTTNFIVSPYILIH